jgi:hypothetical protein
MVSGLDLMKIRHIQDVTQVLQVDYAYESRWLSQVPIRRLERCVPADMATGSWVQYLLRRQAYERTLYLDVQQTLR